MLQLPDLRYDVATGLSLGAREEQEDSVLCDVPQGGGAGVLLLADGLGGHAGGALASRVAVTTALQEIAARRDAQGRLPENIPATLRTAAEAANHAVLAQSEVDPELQGMGTTLVMAVVQDRALYWLSVGDSPLYLHRDGKLAKINATHSLAPHLDLLVEAGEMDPEEAAVHPGRNCLTSALGTVAIEKIDCPETPRRLEPGDSVLVASDGILSLKAHDIATALDASRTRALAGGTSPGECVERLLRAVVGVGAEDQDNTSLALLRVGETSVEAAAAPPPPLLERLWSRFQGRAASVAASVAPRVGLPGRDLELTRMTERSGDA
ncbi:MAG: protein phosphatase 2C domain-containing protein [Pseudomonadota bacterium]